MSRTIVEVAKPPTVPTTLYTIPFEPGVRVPGTGYTAGRLALKSDRTVAAVFRGGVEITVPEAVAEAVQTGLLLEMGLSTESGWAVRISLGERSAQVDMWADPPSWLPRILALPEMVKAWKEKREAENAKRIAARAESEKAWGEKKRKADELWWRRLADLRQSPLAPLEKLIDPTSVDVPRRTWAERRFFKDMVYREIAANGVRLPWGRRLSCGGRVALVEEMAYLWRRGADLWQGADEDLEGPRAPRARAARILETYLTIPGPEA